MSYSKRNNFNKKFYKKMQPENQQALLFPALQTRTSQQSITANLWPLTTHIYHVMIIVTGGFSNKSFFIIIFRSSCMQMFFKTGVIRNFSLFTGKHLCWSLFLIKLQALQAATLFQPCLKRDFNTGVFLRILQHFQEQLFLENTSNGSFCQFDKVTVQ